jgi:short-subunit dehydrogenase
MHVALFTNHFIPIMLKRKSRGALINVGSQIGYVEASNCNAVYCAAKAFVKYLTEGVALEVGSKLDVQHLAPGPTSTSLVDN